MVWPSSSAIENNLIFEKIGIPCEKSQLYTVLYRDTISKYHGISHFAQIDNYVI